MLAKAFKEGRPKPGSEFLIQYHTQWPPSTVYLLRLNLDLEFTLERLLASPLTHSHWLVC